ncbi:MAG: DUF4962 domain-containing protein [Victivallaceae bacterium]
MKSFLLSAASFLGILALQAGVLQTPTQLNEFTPGTNVTVKNENGVWVLTQSPPAKYCGAKLKLPIYAAPDISIDFDYQVEYKGENAPSYLGVTFEDQTENGFFFRFPVGSGEWQKASIPLHTAKTKTGTELRKGLKLGPFNIYTVTAKAPWPEVTIRLRNYRVTDNNVVDENAAVRVSYSAVVLFDWKFAKDAKNYRLEIAADENFSKIIESVETVRNFATPSKPLPAGMIYYRVLALPGDKQIDGGRVLIPERHHTYMLPAYDFAKLAATPHPRLTPLARYNVELEPDLLKRAQSALKVTLPEDIKLFTPGADPRFPGKIDWRRFSGSTITGLGKDMQALGQAALLSGDVALIAKAKELALGVATKWDPAGSSSADQNDLAAANLLFGLGFCYDAAFQSMTPAERELVNANLLRRTLDFWDNVNPFRRNEAQNHSWENTAAPAFGAIVIDNHGESADWFDFALKLYAYRFLPSLGFEGENNEGLAYWRFGFNIVARFMDIAKREAGVDLYQMPYVRATSLFGLYSAPQGGYELSFGDNGTPNHHAIWTYSRPFCRKLAIETGEGVALFYATLPAEGKLVAASPLSIPQSQSYAHIGVTFFNTFLPDARENVAVGFHSGKFFAGHQHADQNGFAINAYGDKLVTDGGYYDWYGSEHFNKYAIQTLAHNTILVDGEGQAVHTFGADGASSGYFDSPGFGFIRGDAAKPLIYGGKLKKFDRQLLFLKPDFVAIFDRLESDQPRTFSNLIHAQSAEPIKVDGSDFAIRRPRAKLDGRVLTAATLRVAKSYQIKPNDQWSSDILDLPEPEWTLFVENPVKSKAFEFLTAMKIDRANTPVTPLKVEKLESPDAIGGKAVAVNGDTVEFLFNRTPGKTVELGTLRTDGAAAAIRRAADGSRLTDAVVIDGKLLDVNGKNILFKDQTASFALNTPAPTFKETTEILSCDGAAVPGKLETIPAGDGSVRYLFHARIKLSDDAPRMLAVSGGEAHYLLGATDSRYSGTLTPDHPAKFSAAAGDYLLAISSARPIEKIELSIDRQAKTFDLLPSEPVIAPDAIRLEAEKPHRYTGEELYFLRRDFASGNIVGLRQHQAEQSLEWIFTIPQDGKYNLAILAANEDSKVIRDLILDHQLLHTRWNSTGGDGRKAPHWKLQSLPEPLTLSKGQHTLKLQFNQKTTALDAVILTPVK